jgi:hypothetical protein
MHHKSFSYYHHYDTNHICRLHMWHTLDKAFP